MNAKQEMKLKIANFKKQNPGKSHFVTDTPAIEIKPGSNSKKVENKAPDKMLTPETKKLLKDAGNIGDLLPIRELSEKAIRIAQNKKRR